MNPVLNIAAYQFLALDDLPTLREKIFTRAQASELKGTVILAEEGVNLALAGEPCALRAFMTWLHDKVRFTPVQLRENWSNAAPFNQLKVKVKCEIIRMGRAAIEPGQCRAPAVDAITLMQWLAIGHDELGRKVALLDTRNAFEVDRGAFIGAVDWRLSRFSEFPEALAAHVHELQGKTVVAYCTGGIRCEKASLAMRQAGLDHAYQLEGGILKYFEDTRCAPHWQGECFVFDQRGALDVDGNRVMS